MVYFLQSFDGGPVKIGHSNNVETRHHQLEATYGRPLVLLGTMPGGEPEEQAIHGRFAHLRLGQTEQFRPAPVLMEFIGRPLLASPNPDTVEAMGRTVFDIIVPVPRALYERLRAVADSECNSVQTIVRRAVIEDLRRRGITIPPRRRPDRRLRSERPRTRRPLG